MCVFWCVVVRRGIQVSSAQLFPLVVAKQNTLKRQRQAEKARIRNKSRRSAVKTRMKKVRIGICEWEYLGVCVKYESWVRFVCLFVWGEEVVFGSFVCMGVKKLWRCGLV